MAKLPIKHGKVPKPRLRTRHLSTGGKSSYGPKAPAFHPSGGLGGAGGMMPPGAPGGLPGASAPDAAMGGGDMSGPMAFAAPNG